MIDDLEYSIIYVELYNSVNREIEIESTTGAIPYNKLIDYKYMSKSITKKLGKRVILSHGKICSKDILSDYMTLLKGDIYYKSNMVLCKSNIVYRYYINVKIRESIFNVSKFFVNLNDGKIDYHKSIVRGGKINVLIND